MTTHTRRWILSISTAIIVALSVSAVLAWTAPTQAPPLGTATSTVDISVTGQVKAGTFWASAIGSDSSYCIGGSCKSSWPADQWTQSGVDLYYAGGNVGIGTTTPATTLAVNGYVRLAPQIAAPVACDAAHTGSITVASVSSHVCVCNGTSWVFDYNGAACAW